MNGLTHEHAFELLPWLVNGTLMGAEREATEAHARACVACRRELKELERLQAGVRARRTADVSLEAGFARLDRALDAATRTSGWPRPSRTVAATPLALAAAAGIAVLAILLWLTPLPLPTDPTYSTLSTRAATGVASIDIVFAADATAAEMQALLDDIDGEIVAGPSELGRYSVRVRDELAGDAQLNELLRALTADSRVRFAGRSLAEVQP